MSGVEPFKFNGSASSSPLGFLQSADRPHFLSNPPPVFPRLSAEQETVNGGRLILNDVQSERSSSDCVLHCSESEESAKTREDSPQPVWADVPATDVLKDESGFNGSTFYTSNDTVPRYSDVFQNVTGEHSLIVHSKLDPTSKPFSPRALSRDKCNSSLVDSLETNNCSTPPSSLILEEMKEQPNIKRNSAISETLRQFWKMADQVSSNASSKSSSVDSTSTSSSTMGSEVQRSGGHFARDPFPSTCCNERKSTNSSDSSDCIFFSSVYGSSSSPSSSSSRGVSSSTFNTSSPDAPDSDAQQVSQIEDTAIVAVSGGNEMFNSSPPNVATCSVRATKPLLPTPADFPPFGPVSESSSLRNNSLMTSSTQSKGDFLNHKSFTTSSGDAKVNDQLVDDTTSGKQLPWGIPACNYAHLWESALKSKHHHQRHQVLSETARVLPRTISNMGVGSQQDMSVGTCRSDDTDSLKGDDPFGLRSLAKSVSQITNLQYHSQLVGGGGKSRATSNSTCSSVMSMEELGFTDTFRQNFRPTHVYMESPFNNNVVSPLSYYHQVPEEYYHESRLQSRLPPAQHIHKLRTDTLFFLFYVAVKDQLQMIAAEELYRRGWRYNKLYGVWIGAVQGQQPDVKTPMFEQGLYQYFDVSRWRRLVAPFTLDYSDVLTDSFPKASTNHHHQLDRLALQQQQQQQQVFNQRQGSIIGSLSHLLRQQMHEQQRNHLQGTEVNHAVLNAEMFARMQLLQRTLR